MRTKNLVMLLATVLAFCCETCAAEHKSREDDSNGALINVEGSHENMITPENADAVTEKFLTDSSKVFVPTDEWQKLDPDQVVPRGSHVRLNLETGEREAKLLEKDGNSKDTVQQTADAPNRMERLRTAIEEAMKELEANKDGTDADGVLPDDLQYWKHADKEGIVNLKNRHFTKDELKQALKKFKASRDDVVDKRPDAEKKFRTIDEIREDFKNLNMDMKTDLELLTETLEQYRRPGLEVDERLAILADLEYYLHQIDNAKNFADMGGLALIVTDLNSTVEEVRKAAALAVSSAVQSNPSVQVVAIESGAMQQLIRMLSTDPSVAVRTRSLGTLSSLVRHFPYAQRKFLELGGLQALSDLLAQYGTISGLEKVSVKAVTLVNDLLTEKAAVMADSSNNDEVHEQRRRQYSQVPLLDSVVENGWCRMVPRLLELSEHDSREKVIGLMWTLSKHCKNDFARYLTLLEHLKLEYAQLSGSESVGKASDDSDSSVFFFSDLLRTIDDVISHVSDEQVRKVEL